jgi:hypothetical protein
MFPPFYLKRHPSQSKNYLKLVELKYLKFFFLFTYLPLIYEWISPPFSQN